MLNESVFQAFMLLIYIGGGFFTVIGLFVFWHILRPQKSPADTSNRINKFRLWWFAMTREELFVDVFPWLKNDELENITPAVKPDTGMMKYDYTISAEQNNQIWPKITKIVVPTLHDKQQLLKASEYIHYLPDIDTDYLSVNTISHLYQNPDLIVVESEVK